MSILDDYHQDDDGYFHKAGLVFFRWELEPPTPAELPEATSGPDDWLIDLDGKRRQIVRFQNDAGEWRERTVWERPEGV